MRERERERERVRDKERQREREREREGGSEGERKGGREKQTERELGGQEIKSQDLSHMWFVSKLLFSCPTFTQGLKITGK